MYFLKNAAIWLCSAGCSNVTFKGYDDPDLGAIVFEKAGAESNCDSLEAQAAFSTFRKNYGTQIRVIAHN